MKNDLFDRAVAEVRGESPDPSVVEAAAARVRARILTPAATDAGLHQIRGCADFQFLIAGYLAGRLTPARRLLLEDHIHSCVHCRHAFEYAKTGKLRTLPRPVLVEKRLEPRWKWAVAAVLALGASVTGWGVYRGLAPTGGIRATVQSVSGILYAVGDTETAPAFAGFQIGEHQSVRTFENSDATLRLNDGSEVEMASRSEIWIGRTAQDNTIHLTRGSIIVHAAKQKKGELHVATAQCRVSVKGTIFAVTEGTKGSRVSVVQGSVLLQEGGLQRLLKPGEQATTNPAVARTSVQDDISWSRNSAEYLSLLGEFSDMAKQLAQVQQPGLRYSSKLAQLAPPNTVVYAAIPNIGPLVTQANQIFDQHLQTSQVLAAWWNEHHTADGPSLDEIVQKLRSFTDYLGNEVALAVTLDDKTKAAVPLVMAEVTRQGLADYLQQLAAGSGKNGLQVITKLPDSPSDSTSKILYAYVSGNFLFVSPSMALLAQADAAAKGNGPEGDYRLYGRIQQAYQAGVGWLLAADMEQIRETSVPMQGSTRRFERRHAAMSTGIENLESVVLERKEVNGTARNAAAIRFEGGRSGMAAWLAAPAPIGSLDFVSPDAGMVTAAAIKDHGAILWDMLNTAENANPDFKAHIQAFENRNGMPVFGTLANSLGGDFTFAIDGALLPIPSWKLAIEVYNPTNCEWAIEQIVNGLNSEPNVTKKLVLQKSESNGRTYYSITAGDIPLSINYTFVDNYLLAGASQDVLAQAIQNRNTGYTLTRSSTFTSQFPSDGNLNFSGLLYYNAGPALSAASAGLSATNLVTPQQKAAIASLAANSKPGMVYAYGQPDQILVSSTGGFFGLNLDTLSLPAAIQSTLANQLRIGAVHLK